MQSTNNDPTEKSASQYGKTCPVSSAPKTTLSGASSVDWSALGASCNLQGENGTTLVMSLDPKDVRRGECLMLNISEWPNAAAVCLLSQVLETGSTPERYYLSAKACAGILRRAEKRGKTLPTQLQRALENRITTEAGV
jgi:hypothetical protein